MKAFALPVKAFLNSRSMLSILCLFCIATTAHAETFPSPFGQIRRPHPQVPEAVWDNYSKISEVRILNGSRPLMNCKGSITNAMVCATTEIFLPTDSTKRYMHEDIWVWVKYSDPQVSESKFTIGLNPKFVSPDLSGDCEKDFDKYVLDSQRHFEGKIAKEELLLLIWINQEVHDGYKSSGVKFDAIKGAFRCEGTANCQTTAKKIMTKWKEKRQAPDGKCIVKNIGACWVIGVFLPALQDGRMQTSQVWVEIDKTQCRATGRASALLPGAVHPNADYINLEGLAPYSTGGQCE